VNHWLHLVGFRIWGSNAGEWAGVVRLRPSGQPATYPVMVQGFKEGVLLKFAQDLDEASVLQPAHYSLQRWNYRRSSSYGSGYFQTDGASGTERVGLYGAHLTEDRRGVFLSIADPRPVMQLEVVYRIRSASEMALEGSAYLTLHTLPEVDWKAIGLKEPPPRSDAVHLAGPSDAGADEPASMEQGRMLYETMGCMACHSTDGSTEGRVGPSFAGLSGQLRSFAKGPAVSADRDYLRESMLKPAAKVVKAYAESDVGMPSYEGVLSESQIDSLILFIQSLAP